MSQSYCQLKSLMSECIIHVHRRVEPKKEHIPNVSFMNLDQTLTTDAYL